MPEIWRRLESVGLQTTEACGDCPRIVLGSPVAGVSPDEVIDPTPAIDEIVRRYVGDKEYSNLPRKFKTSISWLADTPYEANDISFLGVEHPEHGPGFDLWVGGGLSTNPRLAERLGVWVPLDEIPDVWAGVVGIFRDYGYRRLRHRARLKFLLADWGVEKFREILEKEYLGRALLDGPAPELPDEADRPHRRAPAGDGRNYVGAAPVVGRSSGSQLTKLADAGRGARQRPGAAHARTRSCWFSTSPTTRSTPWSTGLRGIGLEARPSAWRRGTMACTGIEYCKLAIVETKARGEELVARLEERLRDFDADISIHINGCPNACARTQVADIGLKGQLVVDPDGQQVEGFQVHLGGGLGMAQGQTAGFGRKLRGLKTTADELPEYVERLARRYLDGRTEGETFANWVVGSTRRSSCSERNPSPRPLLLPVLRRGGPAAQRGVARRLGVPLLRPGLHGQVQRTARQGSEPMTVLSAGRAGTGRRWRRLPVKPADPARRTPAELKVARRRGRPSARGRARRGDRPLGGRDVRRPVLRDQLDGRRRASRTWCPGSRPASTWSSSTPACTSRRR